MRPNATIAATLSLAILTPPFALAQAPPKPTTPIAPKVEQLDPNACATNGAQATIGQGGDVELKKPNDRSLSSKLAQSGGVICPPQHVDPEIHQPAPQGGPMPVIPPPGSPGGDPSVQPK
jgi:hypothetical protein